MDFFQETLESNIIKVFLDAKRLRLFQKVGIFAR